MAPLVAEVVAVVTQLVWFERVGGATGVLVAGLLIVAVALVALWCWLAARRIRRDLALLDELTR